MSSNDSTNTTASAGPAFSEGLGPLPERAAFEHWLTTKGGWVSVPAKREGGSYINGQAQARWIGWQAAAAAQRERCAQLCEAWMTEAERQSGPEAAGWLHQMAQHMRNLKA